MASRQLPLPFPKGEGLGVGFGVNSQFTMTAWQLPLPFRKGEGLGVRFGVNSQCTMTVWHPPPPLSHRGGARGGVWSQFTMHNDCLAASPPLFPKGRGNAESLNSYNYKL